MEMCLAWGIPPHVMERMPADSRAEMWAHWQFKNIREAQLRERAEMESKAR